MANMEISQYQMAAINRTNKNTNYFLKKLVSLKKVIDKSTEEYNFIIDQIKANESWVINTYGMTSEQILNGEYAAAMQNVEDLDENLSKEGTELLERQQIVEAERAGEEVKADPAWTVGEKEGREESLDPFKN